MWKKKNLYFPLFVLLSYTAIGQIKILPGTTLLVDSATTIDFKSNSTDTIKIEPGATVINNGAIHLSPTLIVDEKPGYPITGLGYEKYENYYSSPLSGINLGNLGLTLSTAIATDSLSIKRYHTILYNGMIKSVARNYEIKSKVNSGLSATITYNYDSTELNAIAPANLSIYQSSDNASWDEFPGTPSNYYVQSASGVIDSLSSFSVFPFDFFDFKIDSLNSLTFYHGDIIKIYYTVTGVLNPGNKLVFEFSDEFGSFASSFVLDSIPAGGSGMLTDLIPSSLDTGQLYRLRIKTTNIPLTSMDNGQNITILEPVSTHIIDHSLKDVVMYPNPANELFFVKGEKIESVIIRDEFGKDIERVSVQNDEISIDIKHLPSAIYFIDIQTRYSVFHKKLVKIR